MRGVRDREIVSATSMPTAALGHTHGLEVIDALAAAHLGQDSLLLLHALRRDDQRDGLPDRLFRGIAEQPLRGSLRSG